MLNRRSRSETLQCETSCTLLALDRPINLHRTNLSSWKHVETAHCLARLLAPSCLFPHRCPPETVVHNPCCNYNRLASPTSPPPTCHHPLTDTSSPPTYCTVSTRHYLYTTSSVPLFPPPCIDSTQPRPSHSLNDTPPHPNPPRQTCQRRDRSATYCVHQSMLHRTGLLILQTLFLKHHSKCQSIISLNFLLTHNWRASLECPDDNPQLYTRIYLQYIHSSLTMSSRHPVKPARVWPPVFIAPMHCA